MKTFYSDYKFKWLINLLFTKDWQCVNNDTGSYSNIVQILVICVRVNIAFYRNTSWSFGRDSIGQ